MLPTGVITRTITLGPAAVMETGDALRMVARVKASRDLIWQATGTPVRSVQSTFTADVAGMELAFPLPVTDQEGWILNGEAVSVEDGAQSHTYTVDVDFMIGSVKASPSVSLGPFVLPQGDGSPVDVDLLIPVEASEGVTVSIPDQWDAAIAAAQATSASALATAVAAQTAALAAQAAAGSAYGPEWVAAFNAPVAVKNAIQKAGGRVCDGVDDHVDIAAAWAAHTTIRLTAGQFRVGGPLTVPQQKAILGSGRYQTEIYVESDMTAGDILTINSDGSEIADLFITGWGSATARNGIKVNATSATGFLLGQDCNVTVRNVMMRYVQGDGLVLTGPYSRGVMLSNIDVFAAVGVGFNLGSSDSAGDRLIAGACGSYGFHISGGNHHVANSKAFYCNADGWLIDGTRSLLSNVEAQDNQRAGFRILGDNNTLAGWLADSNSWATGNANANLHAGVEVGRVFGGGTWAARHTVLSGGSSWDKNEGGRGRAQRSGIRFAAGIKNLTVNGVAVGAPGTTTFNVTKGLEWDGPNDWNDPTNSITATDHDGSAGVQFTGAIRQRYTDAATVPMWRTDFNGTLDIDDYDRVQHYTNGYKTAWTNEWGALRFTLPDDAHGRYFADAAVRAIIYDGMTTINGPAYEVSDRRTGIPGQVRWGRRWDGGTLVRNSQQVTETYSWTTYDPDPTAGGTVPLPMGARWQITVTDGEPVPSWVPFGSTIITRAADTQLVTWHGAGLADESAVSAGTAGTGDTPVSAVGGTGITVETGESHSPAIAFNPGGAEQTVRFTGLVGDRLVSVVRIKTPAAWASASHALFGFRTGAGGAIATEVKIGGSGSPGEVRLGDQSGATVTSSVWNVLSTATWYTFVLIWARGRAQVVALSDAGTVLWNSGLCDGSFGTNPDRLWIGKPSASPSVGEFFAADIYVGAKNSGATLTLI